MIQAPSGLAQRLVWAAAPWLIVLALLVAWDAAARFGLIDARALSRPSAVGALIWQWSLSGYIWPHVGATLFEVASGYVIGTTGGLLVAFVFFFLPRVASLFEPFVNLLNAVPRGVLAPLALVAFGLGPFSKIVLVVLVVFLITLVNLHAGLKEVDPAVVDNARLMGANRRNLVRHVYLPASLVWIVAGMRISIGHAFTTAIICELLGASVGLGWVIAIGQATVKPDWMMAGLFYAAVITLILDFVVMRPLERKGSHWRAF